MTLANAVGDETWDSIEDMFKYVQRKRDDGLILGYDDLRAFANNRTELQLMNGDYLVVQMPFHFGATWESKINNEENQNDFLDYVGFAKNEKFATEATLYGELAMLFQVDSRVKRMTRFTLNMAEIDDPEYASVGIPF